VYRELFTKAIILTKNFRQMADTTGFARICANLRDGIFNQSDLDILNGRFVADRSAVIESMPDNGVYIASENRLVNDVVKAFLDKAKAAGKVITNVWALHSPVHERVPASVDTSRRGQRLRPYSVFNSGTRDQLLFMSPSKQDQFGYPLLQLVIGHRYMVTKNLFLDINVVNGTTGVLVGLLYSLVDVHPIRINSTRQQAATLQPQIPIALIRVDDKFWKPTFDRCVTDLFSC